MNTLDPLQDVAFHPDRAEAVPLDVGEAGRVLRFALRPGQEVVEHRAPSSPLHIVILRGQGMFAGRDAAEVPCGPGTVIVFEPGEPHRVRALDEELVFVAILHKVER